MYGMQWNYLVKQQALDSFSFVPVQGVNLTVNPWLYSYKKIYKCITFDRILTQMWQNQHWQRIFAEKKTR